MIDFVGYGLTTADIAYYRPDHPWLLQTYIWQSLDQAPRFPALHRFLDFWHHNLAGAVHSVVVAHMPFYIRYEGTLQ